MARGHAFGVIVIVRMMIGGAWVFDKTNFTGAHNNVFGDWLFNVASMLVFAVIVGDAITKRWTGVLIDDRNRMSLSRFQLLL